MAVKDLYRDLIDFEKQVVRHQLKVDISDS